MGDLGPSWSSAIGGGLGRRGELAGDSAEAVIVSRHDRRRRSVVWSRGVPTCVVLLLGAGAQ
jgi:hypothetical protein